MREENPKIEVVVWRLGREKAAAAEPRRCRRRIQREKPKKKAEGGGRRVGEKEEGVRVFIVKGGGRVWFAEIQGFSDDL